MPQAFLDLPRSPCAPRSPSDLGEHYKERKRQESDLILGQTPRARSGEPGPAAVTAQCRDGLVTFDIATTPRSSPSTNGYACVCGASSKTSEETWAWSRIGSSALAECLLCEAWVVHLESGPCGSQSILSEVKPPTGEPYPGIRPYGSEGGGAGQPALPTSIVHEVATRLILCRCRLRPGSKPGSYFGPRCYGCQRVGCYLVRFCLVRRHRFGCSPAALRQGNIAARRQAAWWRRFRRVIVAGCEHRSTETHYVIRLLQGPAGHHGEELSRPGRRRACEEFGQRKCETGNSSSPDRVSAQGRMRTWVGDS